MPETTHFDFVVTTVKDREDQARRIAKSTNGGIWDTSASHFIGDASALDVDWKLPKQSIMKIKYNIMTHHSRLRWAKQLAGALPNADVTGHDADPLWPTAVASWSYLPDESYTHLCVIQDDVMLCRGFHEHTSQIVSNFPNDVINLMEMRSYTPEKIWVISNDVGSSRAVVMPVLLAKRWMAWENAPDALLRLKEDDRRLTLYLKWLMITEKKLIRVIYPYPHLVTQRDVESLHRPDGKSTEVMHPDFADHSHQPITYHPQHPSYHIEPPTHRDRALLGFGHFVHPNPQSSDSPGDELHVHSMSDVASLDRYIRMKDDEFLIVRGNRITTIPVLVKQGRYLMTLEIETHLKNRHKHEAPILNVHIGDLKRSVDIRYGNRRMYVVNQRIAAREDVNEIHLSSPRTISAWFSIQSI